AAPAAPAPCRAASSAPAASSAACWERRAAAWASGAFLVAGERLGVVAERLRVRRVALRGCRAALRVRLACERAPFARDLLGVELLHEAPHPRLLGVRLPLCGLPRPEIGAQLVGQAPAPAADRAQRLPHGRAVAGVLRLL